MKRPWPSTFVEIPDRTQHLPTSQGGGLPPER
jgi:hypothetical protein